MSTEGDIEYIIERIKDVYGASHVKHKEVDRAGGKCHLFINDNAVYAACHIGKEIKGSRENHDEFSYELMFMSLFDDKVKGSLVVDDLVTIQTTDESSAASYLYGLLKGEEKYLALFKVPISSGEAEKKAANVAAMVMYDWGINRDKKKKDTDGEKPEDDDKVAGIVTPKDGSETQSA